MSSARALLRVVMLVGALLFGVTASSASATTGHSYADQFGAGGNGDGQFSGGPSGVAVLQDSGDVLASDPGHTLVDGVTPDPRIERFDESGAFVSAFSIDGGAYSSPSALAVDPAGAGVVYVSASDNSTGSGTVLKYTATGVLAYALDASSSGTSINAGAAIAVDAGDGSVYVAATDGTSGLQVVDKFDQAGAFVAAFDGASGSPDGGLSYCGAGLAVGAAHEVYVLDGCKARVDRYSAAGGFSATVDDGSRGAPTVVTADPVSGELSVAESAAGGLQVTSFPDGTTPGQSFGATNVAALTGMAIGHGSGTVFTADVANAVVQRFTVFVGPTVTTAAAAAVDTRSATLNGTVDPGGVPATFRFEYGTDTAYGTSTAETSAGSGTGAVAATAAITGLLPNATYHFRLVASNGAGVISGGDRTLTTASVAPVVDGAPAFASTITRTSARINATINPNHSPTTYHVEYGTSTAYGLMAPQPDADAGSANTNTGVAVTLIGLTPGTTYHFRVVADNGTGGRQHGADGTFTTTAPGTFVAAPVSSASPPIDPSAAYGCDAPHIDAYHSESKPGDTIAITGVDLGVGGTIDFGDRSFTPADWSATGFTVQVPDDAGGTLPLTVNCGRVSNTVDIAIYHQPDNAFTITKTTISGTTARLSVKVAGAGKLETLGHYTKAAGTTSTKAGVATIKVKLSTAGAKALRRSKSRSLKVSVRVRFSPAAGKPASKFIILTFSHKAGR
jgi:hypothetical protein